MLKINFMPLIQKTLNSPYAWLYFLITGLVVIVICVLLNLEHRNNNKKDPEKKPSERYIRDEYTHNKYYNRKKENDH